MRRHEGGFGEITGDKDKENFLENTQNKNTSLPAAKWNYA